MTDRAAVRTARAIVAVGATLAVGGSVLSFASGHVGFWWRSYAGLGLVFAVCFAAFVWVVIPSQARNAAVWTMTSSAFWGVFVAGYAVLPLLMDGDPHSILDSAWVPADSPASVAWTLMLSHPASTAGLFLPLTFGLLLFPDGSLPSRRWRAVAVFAAAGVVVVAVFEAEAYWPTNADRPQEGLVLGAAFMATSNAVVLSLVALVRRFRSSTGATRQQFKWILWGAAICGPVFVVVGFLSEVVDGDLLVPPVMLAAVVLLGSYGIAIGRYRLYDVDTIVNRSLTYGALAAFIGVVYIAIVVGVGEFLGGGAGFGLSILATVLVAMAF